ncbi:MAG: methyltransferase [Candidatus Woesearchaeota archaeon]|jgi:SAM-dependent methyltransferase
MSQRLDVISLQRAFETVCSSLNDSFSFQREDMSRELFLDQNRFYLSFLEQKLKATGIPQSELTVYDVGCGDGRLFLGLAGLGYDCVGVDRSLWTVIKLHGTIESKGLQSTAQATRQDLSEERLVPIEKSAVLSLHCCGSLADYVIRDCRKGNQPEVVSIVPCCYNLTNPIEMLKNLKPLFREYTPQLLYDAINFAWLVSCIHLNALPTKEIKSTTHAERVILAGNLGRAAEFMDNVRALALTKMGYDVTIAKVWDAQSHCLIYGRRRIV